MINKISCLLIGLGKVGYEYEMDGRRLKPRSHHEALLSEKRIALTAVVDSNFEKLSQISVDINKYSSLKDCILNENFDMAIVASSTTSHKDIILELIKTTVKVIICEKPLCVNLKDALMLKKVVGESNKLLIVNYPRRWFQNFLKVRNILNCGELGQIQMITGYYCNGVYNNGGHLIDSIIFLANKRIISVSASYDALNSECPQNDLNVTAVMELEEGAKAVLQSVSQKNYPIHEINIYCNFGLIKIVEHGFNIELYKPNTEDYIPKFDLVKKLYREESLVQGCIDEAIKCILLDSYSSSGLENGVEVIKVLDAVFTSAKNNGKIEKI